VLGLYSPLVLYGIGKISVETVRSPEFNGRERKQPLSDMPINVRCSL
jgi:hypothetical protein